MGLPSEAYFEKENDMVKTFLGDIDSCAEHREKNGLELLSKEQAENTECDKDCPIAETCKLRTTSLGLQAAFGESEWG